VEDAYIGQEKLLCEDILDRINAIRVARQPVVVDYRRVSAAPNDSEISVPQSALDKRIAGPSQNDERISIGREPLKQHPVIVVTGDRLIGRSDHFRPPTNFSNR
jgi:hypothetical protein